MAGESPKGGIDLTFCVAVNPVPGSHRYSHLFQIQTTTETLFLSAPGKVGCASVLLSQDELQQWMALVGQNIQAGALSPRASTTPPAFDRGRSDDARRLSHVACPPGLDMPIPMDLHPLASPHPLASLRTMALPRHPDTHRLPQDMLPSTVPHHNGSQPPPPPPPPHTPQLKCALHTQALLPQPQPPVRRGNPPGPPLPLPLPQLPPPPAVPHGRP
jgi:hypothetical protein